MTCTKIPIADRRYTRARERLVLIVLAIAATLSGCSERADEFTDAEKFMVDQSVRVMARGVADDLALRGPIAWLDHFVDAPGFFMASDGVLLFPDFETASDFVTGFAETVSEMDLTWDEIHVDPLSESIAVMGASYHESITDTAGAVSQFGGYFTGLAVETTDGWRFMNLHWSSPPPSD